MRRVLYRHVRIGFHTDDGWSWQRGAVTAALTDWPMDYGTGRRLAAVAFAFCSPEDQFSRAKGRTLAEDRLRPSSREGREVYLNKYHVRLPVEVGVLPDELVLHALNRLKARGDIPTWLDRRLDVFRGALARSAAVARKARVEHGEEKAESVTV